MFLFRNILACGLLLAQTVGGVEWDCAETAGVFDRANDCELGSTVYLTQSLTVNGRLQLTTIRAPSGARHFYVYKPEQVLTIRNLKLVGSGTAVGSHGGSVYAYLGTIISTICWFHNNKATKLGGTIYSHSSRITLVNTNITDSTGTTSYSAQGSAGGGALYAYKSTLSFMGGKLSGNEAAVYR